MDEIYTGEVESLAFGGEGIIRKEGFVVFIPFAAIGDTISYSIVQRKKNFAFGKIAEILQPSSQRTIPLCPYFGNCGGCQLQHLKYEFQLEVKRKWLVDSLKRQAGIENINIPPLTPAAEQWSYRRRVSLVLRPKENSFEMGYISNDNISLVNVDQCPIFVDKENLIISIVKEAVRLMIPADKNEGRVIILKCEENKFLLHFHFKILPQNTQEILNEIFKQYPIISGIFAASKKKSLNLGQQQTSLEVEGLVFSFSPKAFIQNHPGQSLKIYQAICNEAQESTKRSILDLYCGIGISSLLLARQGGQVTGVEYNSEAVQLASDNAKRNGITNASFIQANVDAIIKKILHEKQPDFLVVNPPREGLSSTMIKELNVYKAQKVMYISCMPPTLARDLKLLCNTSYHVKSVQAFDMFPQTTHLETLVTLVKQ